MFTAVAGLVLTTIGGGIVTYAVNSTIQECLHVASMQQLDRYFEKKKQMTEAYAKEVEELAKMAAQAK